MKCAVLLSFAFLATVAADGHLCVNNTGTFIKDMKLDKDGRLFFIDATNAIFGVMPNCGERIQIHPNPSGVGIGPLIPIPTALAVGRDPAGNYGLYVANLGVGAALYFIALDYYTLEPTRFDDLSIQAIHPTELEIAPNGDVFAVEQKQSVIRYNIMTGVTSVFLSFAAGLTDVFDLAISQECPILLITANDNNRIFFCLLEDNPAFCKPIPGAILSNPYGIDYDCACNVYAASQNGTLAAFGFDVGTTLSQLKCAHEGTVSAPAFINADGALVTKTMHEGSATFDFFKSGILWAKTRCPHGNADSWIVNGQRFNVPHSNTFEWRLVPFDIPFGEDPVSGSAGVRVEFQAREPDCEIAQVFLGTVPEFRRILSGHFDKQCASQYVCASEFCVTAPLEIVTTDTQGPALTSPCTFWQDECSEAEAKIVFPASLFSTPSEDNPRMLWLETFCPDGNSDSWFVNGERVNLVHSNDFIWQRTVVITSAEVTLTPRERNCRIRGAFTSMGSAEPTLPYTCECCTENVNVYFSHSGHIFRETLENNAAKCAEDFAAFNFRDEFGPGTGPDEVEVFSTCTFQPTGTGTASSTKTSSSTPSASPSEVVESQSPSTSPSPSPTNDISFRLNTIFITGQESGGASQGNQAGDDRNFAAGQGLFFFVVLLKQVGQSAEEFVRFVDVPTMSFDAITRFRLYSAMGEMRLVDCPSPIAMSATSNFIRQQAFTFLVPFVGAPSAADLAAESVRGLFVDDASGIDCTAVDVSTIDCDATANPAIDAFDCVPSDSVQVVQFTWGVTWDENDTPCTTENGVDVCLTPFPSESDSTFRSFSFFRSHIADPSDSSLHTRLQLNSQIQATRNLFAECAVGKTGLATTECASVATAEELAAGTLAPAVSKDNEWCFRIGGAANSCLNGLSDFGCHCDECCFFHGDCCPDADFCAAVGIIEAADQICHDGSGNIDLTGAQCQAC